MNKEWKICKKFEIKIAMKRYVLICIYSTELTRERSWITLKVIFWICINYICIRMHVILFSPSSRFFFSCLYFKSILPESRLLRTQLVPFSLQLEISFDWVVQSSRAPTCSTAKDDKVNLDKFILSFLRLLECVCLYPMGI